MSLITNDAIMQHFGYPGAVNDKVRAFFNAMYAGNGSPEGVTTAPTGSFYYDTTNGSFYAKQSGSGNTGWVAGVGLNNGPYVPLETGTAEGLHQNNDPYWYGRSYTFGNAPGSIGFAGTPTSAPATTVGSGGVTLPLTNGTVPVADCAALSANGGSFTLGGFVIVYSGRSAASGAGNATGCYTLSTASGTYASGTALGFQSFGFGPLTLYEKFGDAAGGSNRPIPGSTQGGFLIAAYYGPTVDDSAEGWSAAALLKGTGTPFAQHRPVTGMEGIAQVEGGNTMPDGYTAALVGGGFRTNVSGATSHVKNAIGAKLSHNSSGGPFGFTDQYDGLYQGATTVVSYTTLNGAATLPTSTIAVADGTLMPPATAAAPVTVLVGPNADGVGGQLVTYTGISVNNLTGCTGGTGTIATGSRVTNIARAINVLDLIGGAAGLQLGATGFSASILAALRGGTDADQSMLLLTGPTNAEVTGGLTQLRLNAGSGQTKQIIKVYDTGGTNRFSVTAGGQITLNGSAVNMQQSGVQSARVDSTGYIQPGSSIAAGQAATLPGAKIYSGTLAPIIVGVVGDWYIRIDGGVGSTLYRCTTAGAAGAAVWTAIL